MSNYNQDENIGGQALDEGVAVGEEATREMHRAYQRHQIKKNYYRKDRDSPYVKSFADKMKDRAEGIKDGVKDSIRKIAEFLKEHPVVLVVTILVILFIWLSSNLISLFQAVISSMGDTVLVSTYTAYDEDITGVDADYVKLEQELQKTIENTETDYPGYDEYEYNLEEIGHNPYELASYLTVKYEDYKRSSMKQVVKDLFNEQYDLSYTARTERRSRQVTKTGTKTVIDKEGNPHTVSYTYTETEYYHVRILTVTLKNNSLGTVIASKGMNEDEQARYALLLETQGNKAYLFDDAYVDYEDPEEYQIPPDALSDQTFAAMIAEGEKYLGRAYVWGGSSPSTGFDCSGFVSWVINHSGWNIGRQTADQLKHTCTVISPEEAKPGDLIFFKGTYDTSGASHVGIYCGNGMMLHCGNPIQYTSINTKYWQQHFYCYGRLP